MILPSKHLSQDRALVTLGADLLGVLRAPKTVSGLWNDFKAGRGERAPVGYDWFVLALDLLFILGLVAFDRGLVVRREPAA